MAIDAEVLTVYQWIGATLLLTITALFPFLFKNEILKTLELELGLYKLVLYITTAILLVWWMWSTWYELRLLCKWLDPECYAPPTGPLQVVIIAFLVVVLAILFKSVPKIEWYAAIFALYSLFNIYGGGINMLSEIGGALNESQTKLASIEKTSTSEADLLKIRAKKIAFESIRNYWAKNLESLEKNDSVLWRYKLNKGYLWLKNPYLTRLVIIFFVSLIPLATAILAKVNNSSKLRRISYIGLIIILVLSETIIFWWRVKRTSEISKAEELLNKSISIAATKDVIK